MRFALPSSRLSGSPRALLRLCGLAVLVLGAVGIGAGDLLASCGDYLHHAADSSGPWRLGQGSPERLPCQGPGCSKSKAPLQIPPAPVFQFSSTERGWLPVSTNPELTSETSPQGPVADAGTGLQPLRDRLERPPQSL